MALRNTKQISDAKWRRSLSYSFELLQSALPPEQLEANRTRSGKPGRETLTTIALKRIENLHINLEDALNATKAVHVDKENVPTLEEMRQYFQQVYIPQMREAKHPRAKRL